MTKKKLKSRETKKILEFGEAVRENPNTILLSIPIFCFGIIYYTISGYQDGVAGSYGHMGITFKNYYRHYWKQPLLLKIAYVLFFKASELADNYEGKTSTVAHSGQVAVEIGDYKKAYKAYDQALKYAQKAKDKNWIYYVKIHIAKAKIQEEELDDAQQLIEESLEKLRNVVDDNSDLYLHIWYSNCLLAKSELLLAQGDYMQAQKWAKKAKKYSVDHKLEMRVKDAESLLKKIKKTFKSLVLPLLSLVFHSSK